MQVQAQVQVQGRGTDTGTGTNLGLSVSNKSTVRVLCWDNLFLFHYSLTVVHNFRVLVGFKESGVVPKILPGRCRQRPPGSSFSLTSILKNVVSTIFCLPHARSVPGWCRVPWGSPWGPLGSSWGPPGVPGVHLGSSWGPPRGRPVIPKAKYMALGPKLYCSIVLPPK